MAPMAQADRCSSGRRQRFAVACSVLSRCVRAEAAAGNIAAAAAQAQAAASTMLLMPGTDVVSREETAATAPAPAQLTIMYGGRVLVFDDVPAGRAAEVMRAATAVRRQDLSGGPAADLQVARKASLQRFMEKRRDRFATRAPYAPARPAAVAPKNGQEERGAGSWLGLGIHGGCAC